LQSVYRYRTDVTNLNLSLANADWYLKELRDRHNVPLALSDQQINSLRPGRTKDGRFVRIQDQIMDYLIATSGRSPRPIDFAITIPSSGRRYQGVSIDNRLTVVGRTYQLRQDTSGFDFDAETSDSLLFNEFGFRSLGNDGVYQDPVSMGMTNSYANDFNRLANAYRKSGNVSGLIRVLTLAHKVLPANKQLVVDLVEALYVGGMSDSIAPLIQVVKEEHRISLIKNWARVARRSGHSVEAVDALKLGADIYPEDKELFYGLLALQQEAKRFSEMLPYLQSWLERNPQDTTARNMYERLNNVFTPSVKKAIDSSNAKNTINTTTGSDSN
ncbi:tetratricopeptide repeat protein, partial [Gemmatimonas aurantiaca]|nr:tetratricopeptide repeat protein [Gemmatimonas aurantiaca]